MPIQSKSTRPTSPKGLRDALAAAGARFETRHGREVPVEFSGVEEEYLAARERAVIVDRSHRCHIRVTGKDRLTFLQNMLTNDVKKLSVGQGMPAAVLTRKGTLVADVIAYVVDDTVLLEMEPYGLQPVLEALSRYVVSEDVTLHDDTDEQALLSVEGPKAATLLSRFLDDINEEKLGSLVTLHVLQGTHAEVPLRVSAARHGPGPAFDLASPASRVTDVLAALQESGRPLDARLAGWQVQEIRRIEAGLPLLGTDMDASRLPLEVGLDEAISFTKGCYIGQEYVVRLAHRGHLNRKLTGLAVSGREVPEAGSEIYGSGQASQASQESTGEKAVGQVTSAAYSPGLEQAIALCYLQTALLEPGTPVTVRSEGRILEARVTDLPFI